MFEMSSQHEKAGIQVQKALGHFLVKDSTILPLSGKAPIILLDL